MMKISLWAFFVYCLLSQSHLTFLASHVEHRKLFFQFLIQSTHKNKITAAILELLNWLPRKMHPIVKPSNSFSLQVVSISLHLSLSKGPATLYFFPATTSFLSLILASRREKHLPLFLLALKWVILPVPVKTELSLKMGPFLCWDWLMG